MTVTSKQLRVLMKEKLVGTAKQAAMKANMSEKTARKYLKKKEQSPNLPRNYKTRHDPFKDHWPEVVSMLEESPTLEAQTLMDYLCERYPDHYKLGQVRTLQRRLARWRAESGPEKLCIFRQKHHPGRQSQSDWTHMKSLKVTIGGEPFDHLIYHFVLSYSGFETIMVCHTESFETLTKGFEQAVCEIGGVCETHRTDNLSAATKACGNSREFTDRWRIFMEHYGALPSRNNPGESHENGVVENSHGIFKNAVQQQLLLRRSSNFHSLEEYETFLNKIKDKRNWARREKFAEEQKTLKALPDKSFYETTILRVRVTPASLIHVLGVTYSVPTRLIGEWLKVYADRDKLEIYLADKAILTLPRLTAGVLIDYRHLIDSLVRKPGAFENYQHQACLFPNLIFRRAYEALKLDGVSVSKRYCELLHVAKMEGEQETTIAIELLLEAKKLPLKQEVKELVALKRQSHQEVKVYQPPLQNYDLLLGE